MKHFEMALGKSGGIASFEITSENHLKLIVRENGQVYNLTLKDCVLTNKFSHDWHMLKMAECFHTFTNKTDILVNDNKILFTTIITSQKAEAIASELIVYNLFTVFEDISSIKLETYFEQKGAKLYDCCFSSAYVGIEKDFFDTVYVPSENAAFSINRLSDAVRGAETLVLRGKERFLKICGGLVEFNGSSIDAHANSRRYNDDLTYYGKDNPVVSYLIFEDTEISVNKKNKVQKKLMTDYDVIPVHSGKMKVDIAAEEHCLSVICDEKKYPLCAMRFKSINSDKEIYVDTLSFWEKITTEHGNNTFVFTLSNDEGGDVPGVEIKVTAEVLGEKNQIEWSTEVINNSTECSLVWCTYPRLYVNDKRTCDLFEPIYGGNIRKTFSACYQYTGGTYPSGFYYTMPYFAMYENNETPRDGIYFAVHDTSGALKELYACCDNDHNVRFSSRFYAENMYQPQNSQKLPGKAIWKVFDGDWYDAADIYREFVRNDCGWAEKESNKNTPDWMMDIPFWIMDWVPYDANSNEILPTALRCDEDVIGANDWYENAVKIKKEFDTPIGYHIYNWHRIPFNNDYPHFVPARERFLEGYKALKENGIRVMPYINAILWDTKDHGCEDYMFESVGKKGAVKKADGEVETLVFESKESNGEPVKLAPMCPSGSIWKDMLINLTDEMFHKYNFDAIYLDQIAARVPHLCMDKSHGHPLGGGSWWIKGYNEILKELHKRKPKDKAFTSECNAEVYTQNINAFLSWRWNFSENDVPAFMRIYSDRVHVFGRNTNGKLKNDIMYWKYHVASEFVCGQQLGWINSDIVKKEYHMKFLKQLVQFRYAHRAFFRKFEVLRPPVVVKTRDNVVRDSECGYSVNICDKPYLCTGVLCDETKKMMLIVNIADRDITSDIRWNADAYNFKQGEFTVLGSGQVNSLYTGLMNITIDKNSYMCIEWM